jgi:hypothetical protein
MSTRVRACTYYNCSLFRVYKRYQAHHHHAVRAYVKLIISVMLSPFSKMRPAGQRTHARTHTRDNQQRTHAHPRAHTMHSTQECTHDAAHETHAPCGLWQLARTTPTCKRTERPPRLLLRVHLLSVVQNQVHEFIKALTRTVNHGRERVASVRDKWQRQLRGGRAMLPREHVQ